MKFNQLQTEIKSREKPKHEIKIAIISNIIFEPYLNPLLQSKFFNLDTSVCLLPVNYAEYATDENQRYISNADSIVVCLNFELLYPNAGIDTTTCEESAETFLKEILEKWHGLYKHIKRRTRAPILWFGFEDYGYPYHFVSGSTVCHINMADRINCEFCRCLKKEDTYIDLKRLIANVGIQNAYNEKGKYRWNAPYSPPLIAEISEEIYKQHLIHIGVTKKCIVLDCDNVLWGGIVSEDGIENLCLGNAGVGRIFQDFQRYLLYLYYHGVILTVCSKNDLADVLRMFREHSAMILKEEHIACFQVNWENKPDNIRSISKILNIGLDSMIFIDDSDFEIESVKTILPEVQTIKYDRYSVYAQLSCFNLPSRIDMESVTRRHHTYKTNGQREKLKSESRSLEAYIASLEMRINIHPALTVELSRIAELTQRANRCTNGKRYTVEQLQAQMLDDTYMLVSISVSDRFSDLGIVGVVGVKNTTLDLFVLSCRALGRNIEEKMFELLSQRQVSQFEFIPTAKNDGLRAKISVFLQSQMHSAPTN